MLNQVKRLAGLVRGNAIRRRVLLAAALALAGGALLTQAYGQESQEALAAQLAARSQGEVAYHAQTGLLRYYSAGPDTTATALQLAQAGPATSPDPQTVARSFLDAYGSLFGVHAPDKELALHNHDDADRGRSFLRYQQLYHGVPVMAGELILQVAADTVLSAHGELAPITSLGVDPNIPAAQARENALAAVAKANDMAAEHFQVTEPELWVYDPRLLTPYDMPARLVWRMEVSSPDAMLHQLVLVDAHLGAVALQLDLIQTGLNRAIYDSNNTRRNDLPGITRVRTEGQNPSGIADADLAYDYLGDTYAFYHDHHGRDSYDGRGAQLTATVRYCPSSTYGSCPYQNAFWDGSEQQFAFGQDMVADDVTAHEYTHAVTSNTSNLYYLYQSGAINEALSDIWGEFVDLTNGRGDDSSAVRWLMGEDLPQSIGVIRNMAHPPAYDQPDRVTSSLYWCYSPNSDYFDNGGVHMNSGIVNKAAYLITDGGTFNGRTVAGLGLDKTAALFYELQVRYLTSGTDFLDLSSLLPRACDGLVGTHGFTSNNCQQVRAAVAATELAITPRVCGLDEAPVCPAGRYNNDLFFDDLENTASGNWTKQLIQGYQGWYYPQNSHSYVGWDATYATSGVANLWGYNGDELGDFALAMTNGVALPAGQAAYLHFRHSFIFEYGGTTGFDGGVVEYTVDNGATWQDAGALFDHNGYNRTISTGYGNPLGGRRAFSGTSYGYTSSRLDLTSLAGRTVRFRFRIGTDNSFDDYGWFIDDIRVYTCSATPPTPTVTPTRRATPVPTPVLNYVPLLMKR